MAVSEILPRQASEIASASDDGARPSRFRADIEGLRGVAILLVILFHVGVPGFQGGFVGVDVFFVLSGYLITGLLKEERDRHGKIDLGTFYARRMRRLLPAAAVVLAATVIVGHQVYSPLEELRYASAAAATSAYVSNFWFLVRAADYFSPAVGLNPFLHTWSLAVEEQFYLVWPLLVVLAASGDRPSRRLTRVLVAVSIISFISCVALTEYRSHWAFYLTPTRAWEFGIGGLLRIGSQRTKEFGQFFAKAAEPGLIVLGLTAAFLSDSAQFPGSVALIPVAGTCLVLLAGENGSSGPATRLLTSRPFQLLGRVSYSWYLWHWPFLLLPLAVAPTLTIPQKAVFAVAALGMSAISYRFVESPVRNARTLSRSRPLSVLTGVALTIGCLATALWWRDSARDATQDPVQRSLLNASTASTMLDSQECTKSTSADLATCVFGAPAGADSIVLLGDSHAAHWYPALDSLGKQRGISVISFIMPGCPAADLTVYSRRLRRLFTECDDWRRRALDRIVALRPAAVVVATSSEAFSGPDQRPDRSMWAQGLTRTISTWEAVGVTTVMLYDTPHLGFSAPECLSAVYANRLSARSSCTTPRHEAVDSIQRVAIADVTKQSRGRFAVDFTDLLCLHDRCDASIGGLVGYRDDAHLNPQFVQRLSGAAVERIAPLVRKRREAETESPQIGEVTNTAARGRH